MLAGRSPHERIRAFATLAEPFTVEAGTLTRTMKPRKARMYLARVCTSGRAADATPRPHVAANRHVDARRWKRNLARRQTAVPAHTRNLRPPGPRPCLQATIFAKYAEQVAEVEKELR